MVHPGKALRDIRRLREKTLEDLAGALDSDTGGLSRKERGKEDIPIPMLNRWCEELGVKPSEVYAMAELSGDGIHTDIARLILHLAKLNDNERSSLIDQAEFMASRKKRVGSR